MNSKAGSANTVTEPYLGRQGIVSVQGRKVTSCVTDCQSGPRRGTLNGRQRTAALLFPNDLHATLLFPRPVSTALYPPYLLFAFFPPGPRCCPRSLAQSNLVTLLAYCFSAGLVGPGLCYSLLAALRERFQEEDVSGMVTLLNAVGAGQGGAARGGTGR